MKSENKLCIYTLGRFYVKRGNEVITISSQKAKKRWCLFQMLFTYIDQGLSHSNMINYLNLNINTNPAEALKSLIYYLRKDLKEDKNIENKDKYIINEGGLYSFNKQADYWLDVEAFESFYNEGKYFSEIDIIKAINFYKKAAAMYHGDYLIEAGSQPWVLPARSHYRNLYLHSLIELSQLYRKINKNEEIINLCEKGLKINPYEENLYFLILQALVEIGFIGEARIRYDEFKAFFDQNSLELSSEIKKIGDFLKQNKSAIKNKKSSDNIFLDLLEQQKRKSPLFCDCDTFIEIYSLEKSKNERNNEKISLVNFTFPKNMSKSSFKKAIREFEKILINNLRKSDVICRSSEREVFVLLRNLNEVYEAEAVNYRIINKFREIEKDINLNIGINSISSFN
ncbi:MAG: bacterial transcriptional activator domain-containing protein [Halanaerobium sp.]